MDPKVSIIIAAAVALGVAAYVMLGPTTEAPQPAAPTAAPAAPAPGTEPAAPK
jgi:hypothetical protein